MIKTKLTISPHNIETDISEGESILDALRRSQQNIRIDSPCGGKHTCGKCRVIVNSGSVTPPGPEELSLLTAEELSKNIRISCLTKAAAPFTPIEIEVFSHGVMRGILESGAMPDFDFAPIAVRKRFSFGNSSADSCPNSLSRLFNQVTGFPVPENSTELLRQLALIESEANFDAVCFDDAPIAVEPAGEPRRLLGVAVDIGTTTVAASLIDLKSGKRLAQASDINPQTAYGADVLSRIEYTMRESEGLSSLSSLIVGCLNSLTLALLRESCCKSEDVYCYSVAANTTMLHLLLGVLPRSIALAPFHPVFTDAQKVSASSIGLKHCARGAVLSTLPSISGYIGADILAGIEISGIYNSDDNVLFIDIGTNGEIVLSRRGVLSSCSCAAGPALEGMNISCGMRAADGAIEKISFTDGRFVVETIGALQPVGLCGSGVLDAVAALLKIAAVDRSGRVIVPPSPELSEYTLQDGRTLSFILSEGSKKVTFTQSDIRQVQLAKGAILSGITALLDSAGLSASEVDRVLVAGQFGKHLSEDSLLGSGLLPQEFRGKISYLGNTSLSGAELYLLDKDAGGRMALLSGSTSYLELAAYPGYTKLLMNCMKFPEQF